MKSRTPIIPLCLGTAVILLFLSASDTVPQGPGGISRPPGIGLPSARRIDADFGKIPLQFIPNEGQIDGNVAYYIPGRDKMIYFTAEGLTFILSEKTQGDGGKHSGPEEGRASVPPQRCVVKLDFVGSNRNVKPVGLEKSGTVVSYFKGRRKEWKAGLAVCSKIAYRDLWPGIDLLYSGTFNRMKYEFIVHPGADPSRIRLAYRGAESATLTDEGRLAIATPVGGFEDDVPVAWQEVGGGHADVPVAYALEAFSDDRELKHSSMSREVLPAKEARPGGRTQIYGFDVGEYDRSLPLVLDPAVFVYCGYIGGDDEDYPRGIAVDRDGNAYIVGYTQSTQSSFPVTVGPDLTFNGGSPYSNAVDAFVAKVNASGTALVYCGYIGGSGGDYGYGIAVDGAGNAYVTGYTTSTESDFPVTVGPDLTQNGGSDAFVAKVNPSGTALLYCGYIGGSGGDGGLAIAVDDLGQAYVTGETTSTEATFPLAVGPDLSYNDYPEDRTMGDAFVAKVNASGTALVYCGYIGGGYDDHSCGIAVDGSGCAYVTGYTQSRESTFPVTVGPSLIANGADAFVAKVNASGTALEYCGFIGGRYMDYSYAIAVDGSGSAYITGDTMNDESTFPVLVGPLLTGGGGFVAKVKPDGTGFVYCGFIGPATGRGIAVDSAGCAYITGETGPNPAFPVTVGPDLTPNGGEDAFVAKVNASGTGFDYCGYIGGISVEKGYAVAVDGSGNAYVTGTTGSPAGAPWYFPATVGPDLTHNGYANGDDAFVAKIPPNPVAPPLPSLTAILPDSCMVGEHDFTFVVEGANFVDGALVKWNGYERPTTFVSSTRLDATIDTVHLATAQTVTIIVYNGDGEITNPLTFTINNPLPSLTSISPTSVTGGGPDFRLTLTGSNFFGSPVVRWNGVDMAMSGTAGYTEMWAQVSSSDIATGGEIQITAYNPPPGGGTSNALVFPVSTFTLSPSPASVTVNAGQPAAYAIQLTPQFGSFDGSVSFINNRLPKDCTAVYSPGSVTPGAGVVTTTLTISTRARSSQAKGIAAGPIGLVPPALGLLLAALCALASFRSRQILPGRLSRRWLLAAALIGLFLTVGSCGAGGGGDNNPPTATGTPAGTYQITLAGRSGSMTVSTTVTLIVR